MKKEMLIRDGWSTVNGDTTTYALSSGTLNILAADGKTLFEIQLTECGTGIKITSIGAVKIENRIYDDSICIEPRDANSVKIKRRHYAP